MLRAPMPQSTGMPTDTPRSTFLAEPDAARYLGYSPYTLRFWRREKCGPAYHRAMRSVRYHVADLDAWLLKHRVETRDSRGPVDDDARHIRAGA